MTTERSVSSQATQVLVIKTQGTDQRLHAGQSYVIGRDPQADIVVNDPRVSWRHAIVRLDRGVWIVEDAGSTNGTFSGT
ncbi:MAG: FHA domain-containing protein [Micromonosporaceae bacterium]